MNLTYSTGNETGNEMYLKIRHRNGRVATQQELWDELLRLQKLATCDCGDEFTEHDPGTCVNCSG